MEVFMHNLPDQSLTGQSLADLLQPFLRALGISPAHVECDKAPKKRIANVTFLHAHDAKKFLQVHGEVMIPGVAPTPRFGGGGPGVQNRPRQTNRSNLMLLGTYVYCKPSNRPADITTLKGLAFAANAAKENAAKEKNHNKAVGPPKEDDGAVVFAVSSVGCGHYAFVGNSLNFFPEQEWRVGGQAKFTKLNLIVTLDNQRQLRIPLNTIMEMVWSHQGLLTLTLAIVPWFLTTEPTVEDLMSRLLMKGGADRSRPAQQIRAIAMDDEHAKIVGTCLVYQFAVRSPEFAKSIGRLRNREFTTFTRHDIPINRLPHPTLGSFKEQVRLLREDLVAATNQTTLPFDMLFVLQTLLYNGFLHPGTVRALHRELTKRHMAAKLAGRRTISVDAVKSLMDGLDWPSPDAVDSASDFEVSSLMAWILEKDKEIQEGADIRAEQFRQNPNLTRIYRVKVTPTRITLHGPEVENMNRVLRKYPKNQDFFVRVQFCDETGEDMRFNQRIDLERIYNRFKDVVKRGIQIAGRTYSFLGFSHSSLRSHSVWFSAPFYDASKGLQSYLNIVEALGTFTHIRCPAKCAARIGQAFSETPSVVCLDCDDIEVSHIQDVNSSDGSRCFSDGVGRVSRDMMHLIWENIPQKRHLPTCFQIRYGGAKGMLALDTRLPGKQVCIRDSMHKFESEDLRDLEICDAGSKPIPLVLNRQMIKIMEDMGVDGEWFLRLQRYRLDELRSITANPYNTAGFLDSQNVGQSIRLGKFIRFAANNGMNYRRDPFLRGVVEAVVLRELRLLKHKARIPVRDGMTLFGIMDETGWLQENEVYVTFGFSKSGEYRAPPYDGQELLITRSPALHPGDIQLVRNAVPPKGHPLAAHVNCVVFNRRGTRDLPSMLSGGDLDGDLYNVIWDEDAMQTRDGRPLRVFEPADYPRVPALDIGRAVDRDDMADFFVDFMKTDHLGVIASRHVILADQLPEGTQSEHCKKLAALHSTAVDFSKTGIPVSLRDLPRANRFRPDFLSPGPIAHLHKKDEIELEDYKVADEAGADVDDGEAPRYQYYKSEKILGELYRGVDESRIWHEDIHAVVDPRAGPSLSFWDGFINWALPRAEAVGGSGWIVRVEEARTLKKAYDDAIYGHMMQYSEHPIHPITEREVFIGFIFNKTGVQTHRQRDSSHKLHDEFDRTASFITRLMRNRPGATNGAASENGDGVSSQVVLTGYMAELGPAAALDLCLACVCVACVDESPRVAQRMGVKSAGASTNGFSSGGAGPRRGGNMDLLQSFRVVAASAFLKELKAREMELGVGGGGYVGVSGHV